MPAAEEIEYGYGDAAPSSSNRGRSNLKEEHKVRDRSRSTSRSRSVGSRMNMKTPTGGGKKRAVMDPLAVGATASKLNDIFNNSGGGSGSLEPEEQSDAEDAAMMLPDSTKIEPDEPPESNRQRHKESRTRTENKTRPRQRSRKKEGEKTEKPKHRHHRNSKSPHRHTNSPHRHRARQKSSGDINAILKSPIRSPQRSSSDKSPRRHHHHHNQHHSSSKRDVEREPPKKSSSDTKVHRSKKSESKPQLRAPSLSPKAKKKRLRRKPNDSSSSDDSDSSLLISDSDDTSSSSSSNSSKASDGNTVMQFDPLASGGTVEVGQKEGKDGISEFSDPVGDAQRLQGQSKKPVFSFLDSDCSDDDDDESGKKKGAKRGGTRPSSGRKHASGRPKLSSAPSSRRSKKPEKSKKKEKEKEKEKEKTPEKTYKSTVLSMSGFNSTTCHFCNKDVGPMIMQCMSCKETYFCQKCMRKGLVAPHQQECAQRKVEEREQRSNEIRQRVVKAHKSMSDLDAGTPALADKEKKRRKPKKSDSAPAFTKESESLFDKEPLLRERSDGPKPLAVHQEEAEDDEESPTKSTRKKLGIGKFFGGLSMGKKKKNGGDDNNNNNDDGSGDEADDGSVSSTRRKIFRRPSILHQLMDDDSCDFTL